MTRSKKKIPEPSRFLPRFYGLLPYILLSLVAFNLWFVYAYVRSDKYDYSDVRSEALLSVSNVYSFVMASLSNEIQRVRFEQSALLRPIHYGGPDSRVSPVSSAVTNSFDDVSFDNKPVSFVGDVPATYFTVSTRPFLALGDGLYYGLGSDFGYGTVTSITPLFVVCGGFRYRLVSFQPSSSRISLPIPKKELASND